MRLLLSCLSLIYAPMLFSQSMQEKIQVVNSEFDEQNPVLSPDGQTLFFTIGNHPENTSGVKDPGDIWFSRKVGTGWSTPIHGGPHLNNKAYNAVAGFSADGAEMYLHGHYTPSGQPARTQGLAISRAVGPGWSTPQNISIPYFLNKSGIVSGSLSSDNSVFVFSAESYGTFGVEDLYVSFREGGKWTEPKNLGGVVNTQFQELSPSLSEDKKTLYFSSNGRKGNGSFDIYVSTRLDDSWFSWSTPENMGAEVNSEGRELFYREYPAMGLALYTTTKSSDGYGDLRVYTPREPMPRHDTLIYASLETDPDTDESRTIIAEANTPHGEAEKSEVIGAVRVRGTIVDAKTGELVAARITFEGPGLETQSIVSGEEGYGVEVAPAGYTVRIESPGYISTLEKLAIDAPSMPELEMNFKLQPVEVGTTVNLRNVLFAQAKTDILPESFPELDLVVSFLNENPRVRIELMGHTDGRGVHADNVRLSQQRVNKVKEYLVSRGIDSRRISGKGFGGSKPIASNDTEASRRMNRRVEFVIRRN